MVVTNDQIADPLRRRSFAFCARAYRPRVKAQRGQPRELPEGLLLGAREALDQPPADQLGAGIRELCEVDRDGRQRYPPFPEWP